MSQNKRYKFIQFINCLLHRPHHNRNELLFELHKFEIAHPNNKRSPKTQKSIQTLGIQALEDLMKQIKT